MAEGGLAIDGLPEASQHSQRSEGHSRSDRGAWLAMSTLGACVLLPYNNLLTAQPYFVDHAFKDMNFAFISMLVYSGSLCVAQLLLIFGGADAAISLKTRMRFSFASMVAVCVLLTSWVLLTHKWPKDDLLYVLMLVIVACLAISNSTMQTGVLGVAGATGPKSVNAVMVGLGYCGLLSLATSLIVQVIEGPLHVKEENGDAGVITTVVLFALALLFTLISSWVYFRYLCVRSPVAAPVIASLESQRQHKARTANSIADASRSLNEADTRSSSCDAAQPTWRRGVQVMGYIAPQALNLFSTFVVTMSIFPGVLLEWQPGANWTDQQLFRTLLIGAFQIFDVAGRAVAPQISKHLAPQWNWALALLRVVFVPLFMLGQRHPEGSVLWGSDAGRFCLTSAMALTNGLSASLAMMAGPLRCPEERREAAGMAMSLTMVTGIFIGSLVALPTQIGVSK